MRFWTLIILMAVFPMISNAQSIQPFYEAGAVVFKPELVGKWEIEGVTLEFRDVGNQTYGVDLMGDDGSVFRFRVRLIHIGRNYFLDGQVAGVTFPSYDAATDESKPKTVQKTFELDEHDVLLNRHHGLIFVEFAESPDRFIAHPWADSWLPQMAEKSVCLVRT